MSKIKYTKTELRTQKHSLDMFSRYLPTLTLKKQQLQSEILKVTHALEELHKEAEAHKKKTDKWVDVFAEEAGIDKLIKVSGIKATTDNIAGIDVPVFEDVDFTEEDYDLMSTPLWVDYGINAIKAGISLKIREEILAKHRDLLREELRITTQRVNLFEKVKIPETKENIRRINIVLGDMQTAAVVTGKISKRKIEEKHAETVEA
jgi:V/A-type H+-transporting ATPase subunit D